MHLMWRKTARVPGYTWNCGKAMPYPSMLRPPMEIGNSDEIYNQTVEPVLNVLAEVTTAPDTKAQVFTWEEYIEFERQKKESQSEVSQE